MQYTIRRYNVQFKQVIVVYKEMQPAQRPEEAAASQQTMGLHLCVFRLLVSAKTLLLFCNLMLLDF